MERGGAPSANWKSLREPNNATPIHIAMEKALEVKDHLGYAIEVKDAVKSYGSQEVLKQLNMAVPYGSMCVALS